jgi:intracellular septation protein A
MNPISLFFALLWRTAVVYLGLSLAAFSLNELLSKGGMALVPLEVAGSAAFIKLKPTILFALFGLVLLAAEIGLRFNLVRMVGGVRLNLSSENWRYFVVGLAILLYALAGLNLVVAATTSVATWANYKFWGASCLSLVGILGLAVRISRFPK